MRELSHNQSTRRGLFAWLLGLLAIGGGVVLTMLAGCNVGEYGLNPDDPYYGIRYDNTSGAYIRRDGSYWPDP